MNPIREVQHFVARIPGIGLAQVVPSTSDFLWKSWLRARQVPMYPDIPAVRPSLGMAAQVMLDEVALGVMRSPRNHPHRPDYIRVGQELSDALDMYQAQGWIDDPSGYHRTPPAADPDSRTVGTSRGVVYEQIAWPSGYQPHPDEPGGDRWQMSEDNRTAYAYLVRASAPSDRWLVCIHGFGMGMPLADFFAFRAKKLADTLGLNLAFPVLPMHGPRRTSRMSGADFMSFDLMRPVFGLSQAVWDARSLVSWLHAHEGAARFGVYGISLGAYTASLLVGVDDRFDLVIAGIPASDFARLVRHHSPTPLRRRALEYGMLGEVPNLVHRVVSPLAFEPLVAKSRRFIYGALGDRMSTPAQAHELWNHWSRPRIEWLQGAHVGAVIHPGVDAFVSEALVTSGFAPIAPALPALPAFQAG